MMGATKANEDIIWMDRLLRCSRVAITAMFATSPAKSSLKLADFRIGLRIIAMAGRPDTGDVIWILNIVHAVLTGCGKLRSQFHDVRHGVRLYCRLLNTTKVNFALTDVIWCGTPAGISR